MIRSMKATTMERKIPAYIESSKIVGSPIDYKWDAEIAADLMECENKKLQTAVEKSTFKAGFAIGIAITEWIIWRFEGHAELGDAHNRIEAAWAGVIDPAYVNSLEKELPEDEDIDDKEIVGAPLVATLYKLGEIFSDYTTLNETAPERIVTQAMLARQLIPAKKAFEQWLSASLRRAAEVFPMELSHYNSDTEEYDATYEKPVPRGFFELNSVWTDNASKKALNEFLKSLNPKQNPYLRSAAEMKSSGFKGTPYAL